MPDKKYLIEIPGMPEGSGVWDSDKWERNKDAFMSDYPEANVFELGEYDAEDTNENDQIMLTFENDPDSSGVWDSAKWERNKEAFTADHPEAKVNRVRYVDYWSDRASAIENRLAELEKPDEGRAARLAEIGYFDDNENAVNLDGNLKPVSQAMKVNSVSGDVEYLDPAVEEFFANDDTYTKRQLEKNQLKAEYDANPSVIAQREWEAQRKEAEKAYRNELKQQITAEYESNVDKNKAARGGIEIDGVPIYGPASFETEKQEKYLAALQLLDFAERMENGEKFWEGVGYGTTKAAVDYDGKEMIQVGLAFKKLEDRGVNILEATEEEIDEALDPEDKALMRAYLEYEKAMYEAEPSNAFKGGAQFGETIPFILEFIATGNIYKAGAKKGMELAGKKAIGKGFAKWIAKSAGKKIPTLMKRGVAKASTGTIKALSGTLTRTLASPTTYTKMATPEIQISEQGDVSVETHAAREFFDHYIENLSEISGEGMVAGLGGAAKLLKSTKIGKMPFMKLGEWFGNKAVWQGLSKLGAQSLPIEVAEEIVGNALRYITGVDKEALGRMFEKDEFASMLIGFAPLTVLGMGTSAASMGAVNIGAARAAKRMRETLNPYYTEEQIDNVIGSIEGAKTSDEVVEALRPIMVGMYNATPEEKTAVMDYGISVAKKKAMISARNFQEMQLSDASVRQIEDNIGKFWIENEDKTRTVRQVNLNDGRQVYIVSQPNEVGEVATVEVDTGKKGMAKLKDIKEEIFNSSLESYGTRFVMADRKAKEQERMANERQEQINLVRQNLAAQKGKINLGTEGSPIMVIADAENEAGVRYVAENGSTGNLSWDAVADAMGTPIRVFTDSQIVEQEIADIVARDAERKAQRAQQKGDNAVAASEAVAEASETVDAVAQETKHIPLNEDGTVNEAAFWEQDPEGYAQWNDEQNQDGGADTIQQIEAAKAELTAMLNEAQQATLTSNPANRKAAKREVGRLAERLARLEALEQSYADRALAPLRERAKMWADLTGAPVHVIETEEELAAISATVASENAKPGSRVRGFAKDGKAYIFLPGIQDVREIDEVFFHEAVAHNGLKGLLGKENYDKLCEQVWNMMSPTARNQFIRYPGVNGDYRAAADEYIAHIAEKMGAGIAEAEEKTIWQKIVDFVRNVLRAMGIELNVTEQELSDLLHQAYADLANNMAKAEQTASREAMSAVEEAPSEARQQYDALLEDLTPEEIEAVAQNDFKAAQEAYNAHLANAPKVEPGESSKAYIERKKAYNDELKRLESELNAQQALMDEITAIKAANAPVLTDVEILEQDGFGVDEQHDDVRMSVRYTPTDEQKEAIINSIVNVTGRSREEAERWLASETSLAAMINDDLQYLDYVADPKYKAIKDNSDYPQGTVDFNNICRKRVPFTRMFTRLQRAFPNRVFTADELADIRTIMSKDGLTVACGLCYVEDRRQMVGEVAQSFIDGIQEGFETYANNPTKRKNAEKFKALIGEDAYVPQVYDLTTQEGLDKLYNEHRGIWEAFQAFNNARGQQSQNLLQGYAEYKREILSWSDKKVKQVNDNGGLRIFSYSDFEAHHLIDVVQIIIDCASKGVKIQGYTKVPAFARAVANTGIKLNRSLIPLGDTGLVDGQLAFDPVEGIDINDPDFLESNDNVGNILIGINDEQIRVAMNDPRIHYIIPYHARQKENIRQKLNVGAWTNYISTQNERNVSDGKRVKDNINIYTDILTEDITTDRQFVEKYLQLCAEQGRIPKFDQFLDKDAEGNYVYTPGYYKFLIDFKLFDENGNILPQQPVVAEFDDAFNMQILENYAKDERESTGEQMNETYDKIVDALGLDGSAAEGEDVRFSSKLTDREIDNLVDAMKANAEVAEVIALTPENWEAQFGAEGIIESPVGEVKMGPNQVTKLFSRNREEYFGMIKPTLTRPDVVVEKFAPAEDAERDTKYVFIKSFVKPDGSRIIHFESVTVQKEGREVSVSSHEAKEKDIKKEMQNGKLLHLNSMLSLSSEGSLTEAPIQERPDLVPTSNNVTSDSKDSENLEIPSDSARFSVITPQMDADYLAAVERGDMETAQRMVVEAAKLAMPNTKVVDENGNPKVVYHGTAYGGFTKFTQSPDEFFAHTGFFFADTRKAVEDYTYGENQDVDHFFPFDKRAEGQLEIVNDWLKTKAKGRNNQGIQVAEENGEWVIVDEKGNPIKDSRGNRKLSGKPSVVMGIIQAYEEHTPEFDGKGVYSTFLNLQNPLVIDAKGESWGSLPMVVDGIKIPSKYDSGQRGVVVTDDWVDYLQSEEGKKLGYDSLIVTDVYDSHTADGTITDYIAFDSAQIKLSAPVTYDDAGNVIPLSKRFNPANEDIRFSVRTDEQREKLFADAKAEFGLTDNFNVAGYMLPDGSLLNFGDPANPTTRAEDHRAIEGVIMENGTEYDSRWMYLADFMNEGAIRLLPEYAGINLMKAPTKEQRQRLFDFIYKYNGEVILEIADERLNNVAYVEYDRRTSPSRIFRDIDGYFNEGIVPEQDVRFSVRTVNQTAQEFHNDALTDFRRQFNLIQPTTVVDVNDRAALAKALGLTPEELSDEKYQLILDGVNDGGRSFYDDDTKRIAIFALEKQRTSAEVDENIFHENTHAIVSKNPEVLELGQWLWDNAKSGIRMKTRNSILDSNYPEWQYANEMLSRYTGIILSMGRAGEVLNMLPADQKKHWEFILKEFGYEPEREDGERIRRYDADSRRAGFFRKMSQQKMSDNGASARYSAEERRVINELFPGAIQEETRFSADIATELENARANVDTDPTEAQKEAGNYKMGHLRLDGYNITIENPKGSVRRGTDSKGNEWKNTLNNDYGYIRGTEGVDGDHIDVYLSDNPAEGNVFVIDQVNPETREFDEHKVMYGFNSEEEARNAYLANFSEGWNGLGTITEVTKDEFRKWIDSSHRKTKPFSEYKSVKTDILDEGDIRYSLVTDPALLERLESEPTIKVYRAMQLIDGKLYPPMSAKVDGKMREPIELGKWEQAEERPDLADEKGYFKLDKGNKTSLKARYNPYFHTSPTPLNDQFSSAQTRPELVTVEVEVPESELTSGYKAEKAKDSVGKMEWKAGVIQGKLSGTRTVILSRWDKPVRIVPDSEVADVIVKMFEGKDITMPSNVVTPSLRAELEKRGVPFAETDNQGKPVEANISYSVLSAPADEIVAEGMKFSIQDFARLAGNIFQDMPESFRKEAIEETFKKGWDMQSAIFQIPARLAEKTEWTDEDKDLARIIREKVQDAVDESGAVSDRPLTTKEALWMLYRSTSGNGDDLISAARRSLVAHNLGFDPGSERIREMADEHIRYSVVRNNMIDSATDMYNYEASLWTNRLKESWLDMNQSVISLQNALAEASGKPIEPWENLELALNQLSSRSYADKKKYMRDFLEPLWDVVLEIIEKTDYRIEDIERYMMLKHALERNLAFAKRDAREFYKNMYDRVADRMKNQSHAQRVVALSEAKKVLAGIDARLATATNAQKQWLTEARSKAQLEVDIAELALRGDEQKNEAELNAIYDSIDNGTNPKFLEFREKDYGGLTSMFVDFDRSAVKSRSSYKSEEAYQQAVIAATKPRFDNVADMENAARDEVDVIEQSMPVLSMTLWHVTRKATGEILRHQHASGMITTEQYDAVRNMFQHYVPLRGFADNTAEDMYSYYMNNSSNGFAMPIIGAKGRKTKAESPLGWIGTMAESAIQSDNKNDAKMRLYYALLNRPDTGVLSIAETWYEYTGQKDANDRKIFAPVYPPATGKAMTADELRQHMDTWEADMMQKRAAGNAFKGNQSVNLRGSVVFQDTKEDKEHIIRVKVAGKDYSILVNGNPRAAQAINGLLNPDANVGPVGEWVGNLRRNMSALMTSFSPLFWVSNYQRDLLSSFMRTSESEGWKQAFKYLNNRRKAWRVASYIYKNDKGRLGNSYYENLYKEFAENGGITGYTSLTTNKEYEKLLEEYAQFADKPTRKWIKNAWNNFMGFGEAIEQVSRFAAFITAREAGKSVEEAVNAAKEVSVNFNRKGSAKPLSLDEIDKLRTKDGKPLNKAQKAVAVVLTAMPKGMKELYFFFNASIQALSSSAKLAKQSPGKATAWAGMYMGLSMALAAINYLISGDDDEEEYRDLPDYARRSNALVKISDEYYLKWSLPQEMRPFYATADIILGKAVGNMPHKSVGKEIALAVAEWLPVNPFGTDDPLLSLVPDFAAPLAEIKANKNFVGGKIYDDMAFKSEGEKENIPAYRKATSKTGKIYVEAAEVLNAISGGDEVQKGAININPAVVEHLVEGYGGGLYDFAKMMVSFPAMLISDEDVEVRNIPFVNKVVMSVDETNMYTHTNEVFYHYRDIAENAERVEKEYRNSDDPSRADAYRQEEDWRIHQLFEQYDAELKEIKDKLKNAADKEEEDLLKQSQNAVRELLLNDIATGKEPDPVLALNDAIKEISKEISAIKKPFNDAEKKRKKAKESGDMEGAQKAKKERDEIRKSDAYKTADKAGKDLKELRDLLDEIKSTSLPEDRDSLIAKFNDDYQALKKKLESK